MQTDTNFTSRLKTLIATLLKNGRISSQEDLGHKLGYKNRSYISQAINGKINNEHFIKELMLFEPSINKEWLMSGNGNMFHSPTGQKESSIGDYITYQTQKISALESDNLTLKNENDLLKKKIDTLIDELEEYKKNDVQNLDNFFQMLQMMNEKIDENKEQIEDLQNLIKTQQSA